MAQWWIDEPRVLGSSDPSAESLAGLAKRGFDVLVSLLDEPDVDPWCPPAEAARLGFQRYNLPVKDFRAPGQHQLRDFVALVLDRYPTRKFVVHCSAGLGRTGTMAAALSIAGGASVDAAIEAVRAAAPGAIEEAEQVEALRTFARSPVHVVRRAYDAAARGDIDAVLAETSPDIEVVQTEVLPWGGTYRGREEARAFLQALGAAVSSRVAVESYLEAGDEIVVSGRTSGTARLTGRAFDIAIVQVWTVRDGVITRFHAFTDEAPLRAALRRR